MSLQPQETHYLNHAKPLHLTGKKGKVIRLCVYACIQLLLPGLLQFLKCVFCTTFV